MSRWWDRAVGGSKRPTNGPSWTVDAQIDFERLQPCRDAADEWEVWREAIHKAVDTLIDNALEADVSPEFMVAMQSCDQGPTVNQKKKVIAMPIWLTLSKEAISRRSG